MTEADWPEEIRLSPDKTTLTLHFSDGSSGALPAEYLRVESPSAEVQGHADDLNGLAGHGYSSKNLKNRFYSMDILLSKTLRGRRPLKFALAASDELK